MFLSKLCLNLRDPEVRRQVGQPYEMHRTLCSSGFRHLNKEELGRVLFRIDTDPRGLTPIVLVQSERFPDWYALPPHFLIEPPQCKQFDIALLTGTALRFRLRANPTKKVGSLTKTDRLAGMRERDGNKKNGQRLALLREEEQIAWLLHKGTEGGFTIPGRWEESNGCRLTNFRVEVIPEGWVRCGKNGHSDGRFYAVRFEGVLEVTD